MKKLLVLTMITAMLFIGCSDTTDSTDESIETTTETNVETAEVTTENTDEKQNILIDDLGVSVLLPENPQRIVIADLPPLVHAFYAVNGGTDGLIGAPTTYALEDNMLPTVYPEIMEVSTGFRAGGSTNIEELLSLDPDLILYRADDPEAAQLMQDVGVPAVAFQTTNGDNGNVVTPIASWIEDLSQILGKDVNELDLQSKAFESMGFVQSRVWDVKEAKTSAYLTVKAEKINMLGENQFGFFFQTISHTNDLGGNSFTGSKEISIEQLYEYDPEIIYLGLGSINGEEFLADERFQNLTAVKNGDVYKAPEGLFSWFGPSTDSPLAFIWYAKLAYPEHFADIDLVEITKDYYKENYNYELTDANLEFLFQNSLEKLYATE